MPDQANADAALQATVAGNGVVSTQDNQLRSYAEPQADGAVQSAGDEPPRQSSSNSDIARERLVLRCNEALQRGEQGGLLHCKRIATPVPRFVSSRNFCRVANLGPWRKRAANAASNGVRG
jgi:hypothetical protein